MSSVLKFDNLSGGYGDTTIISNVSGSLDAGEVLGVFGRNGVGKTTLSKLLVGALPTMSGTITFGEKDLAKTGNHARRKMGIGFMPQTSMVFDNLTVRENLSLAKSDKSIQKYFDQFPRLEERQDQLAGSMSGGERKILSFVRVMLEKTSVIVLDEPSEGVQPENIARMQECIKARNGDGTSIILVEQNLSMLTSISDRYIGIESGRFIYEGGRATTNRKDLIKILTI